jgi:WD40 repeat protein
LPYSTKLVSIGESFDSKGIIQIYNLNQGKLSIESEYIQNYPSKCCTFGISSFSSRDLALGDFDGNLSVIDLEKGEFNYEIKKAHKGIIQSIDGLGIKNNQGPPEIVTGGKDGLVKLWDLRSDKPCILLEPKDIKKNFPECWTVRFCDCGFNKKVGIGYDNGDIKIYDLRMDKIFFGENLKKGVCNIEFDKKNIPVNKMIVTTLDSKFYLYDFTNYFQNQKKLYDEVNTTIWGAKFLPQKRDMFVSLGGDGNLNLYKYDKKDFLNNSNDKLNMLSSNYICSRPIIGFDWHLIKNGLACLVSLDNSIKICKYDFTN